jgi:hypothetical protein
MDKHKTWQSASAETIQRLWSTAMEVTGAKCPKSSRWLCPVNTSNARTAPAESTKSTSRSVSCANKVTLRAKGLVSHKETRRYVSTLRLHGKL